MASRQIRDRRKWARGALYAIRYGLSNNTISKAPGSMSLVDATFLQFRIECSGAPLRIMFSVELQATGTGTVDTYSDLFVDGASANFESIHEYAVGGPYQLERTYYYLPSAGSHLFGPAWNVGAGDGLIYYTGDGAGSNGSAVIMFIEELVRQNVRNNVTTSG